MSNLQRADFARHHDETMESVAEERPRPKDLAASWPPDPAGWAFFLDLDGTLLDFAPRPDAVQAVPELAGILRQLETRAGGALALVTGRSAAFVDDLLGPHRFTVAGLHGADLRLGDIVAEEPASEAAPLRPLVSLEPEDDNFTAARALAIEVVPSLQGVLFEDKGGAFALHYRQAPDQRENVERLMGLAQSAAGQGYRLQPGSYVLELTPAHANKGSALLQLMAHPRFIGRLPFAAGDDLTDEDMFRAALDLGGQAMRVGPARRPSLAHHFAEGPSAFRNWIAEVAT